MLWLARDKYGLGLFRGPNSPAFDADVSQSRPDGTCDFVDEVPEVEVPGLVLPIGQSIKVEIRAVKDSE